MQKLRAPFILMFVSLLIIAIAVFASQRGPGRSAHWGLARISLLTIGLLLIMISGFFSLVSSKARRIYFLSGCCLAFVAAVYVWFVSVGTWTTWPKTTNYYDILATSFQHGQLSLEAMPDPALLALPDPYSVQARKAQPAISYIFDASLYKGKFYLYWGPVPALILAGIKDFVPGEIGDQYVVFAASLALLLVQSLLGLRIWVRFFPDLPGWTVLLGILVCGLMSPMTWVLSQPEIYEASVVSGQFFLMAALFLAFLALDRTAPPSWALLFLTSISLLCSVGSRIILGLPAVFIIGMMGFEIIRPHLGNHTLSKALIPLAALALPLLAGASLLGWYNWARFGSFLESGLRYQLSGLDYRNHFNDIFSLSYLPANLYNYLLTPFKLLGTFPFFKPLSGDRSFAAFASTPAFYYSREKITGLLYTAPFLLFALVPLGVWIARAIRDYRSGRLAEGDASPTSLAWISRVLAGTAALSFLTIMVYFYATLRFGADFIPALTVCALIGSWQGYQAASRGRWIQILYSIAVLVLAASTIGISTLLAISGYNERFAALNPALIRYLVALFSR